MIEGSRSKSNNNCTHKLIEGSEKVTNFEILEMLEKQLQLLSERSKGCFSDGDLVALSNVMISISQLLLNP